MTALPKPLGAVAASWESAMMSPSTDSPAVVWSVVSAAVEPPVFGLLVERVGGYGFAWATLATGMVAALLLLIPVRERTMATS